MKKGIIVLFIVGAMLLGLSACGTAGNQQSDKKKTIIIGVLPDVDSIPLIVAQAKGYFKDADVDVKLEHFKSAKDRDGAFQSGKLDGVVGDFLGVLFLKEAGFDVKVTSKTDGSYKLLAGKASGIKDMKSIKGRSVAISKNTLIEYITDQMLEKANYQEADIKKTVIPQIPVRLEMLQNGKVDAATLPEPLASLAGKGGAVELDSSVKMGITPGVMIFKSESISSAKDSFKAFYTAYDKAVDYILGNPTSDYADLLIKEASFPEAIKDSIVLPVYSHGTMATEQSFQDVYNWMKKKELVKGEYSFKDISDSSLLK